jgi:hypothetical protein
MSQQEIQAFSEKLQQFGNSLPENEQKLFAEILLRAADNGDDVEGHGLNLGASWPQVRHHISGVLVQILENMGYMAEYDLPTNIQ